MLTLELQKVGVTLLARELRQNRREERRLFRRRRRGIGLVTTGFGVLVETLVSDSEQPRCKARLGFILGRIACYGELNVLQQSVRYRAAPDIALQIAPGAQLVAPIEQLERRPVAVGVSSDQRLVRVVRVIHRSHYRSHWPGSCVESATY